MATRTAEGAPFSITPEPKRRVSPNSLRRALAVGAFRVMTVFGVVETGAVLYNLDQADANFSADHFRKPTVESVFEAALQQPGPLVVDFNPKQFTLDSLRKRERLITGDVNFSDQYRPARVRRRDAQGPNLVVKHRSPNQANIYSFIDNTNVETKLTFARTLKGRRVIEAVTKTNVSGTRSRLATEFEGAKRVANPELRAAALIRIGGKLVGPTSNDLSWKPGLYPRAYAKDQLAWGVQGTNPNESVIITVNDLNEAELIVRMVDDPLTRIANDLINLAELPFAGAFNNRLGK